MKCKQLISLAGFMPVYHLEIRN